MTVVRLRRSLLAAIPVPLWLLLTYILFAPLLRNLSGPLPGGADSILYSWYFKEIQVSLWNGHNPFFTTAMNAPTGLNIMWNTAIILPAFLMTPITAAFGATTSVGLLMITAPLAAAGICYWVLYKLTGHLGGSAVGATLYGFGPFYNGQQGHVHLTLGAALLPLILYFGYQLVNPETRSWRQVGWRLGVVVGVTMLISEEIVAIAGLVALVSIVALALRYRREVRARLPFVARCVGWAAGVAVCICGPALAYQFLGPLVMTEGIHSSLSLDLLSTVRPSASMLFSTSADIAANRRFVTGGVENTGYLGILLILVAVIAVVVLVRAGRRRVAFWLGSSAALALALSLGTTVRVNGTQTWIPMPWLIFCRLPVVDTLVPARFSVATILFVSALLAFAVATVARADLGPRGHRVRFGGAVLVVVALAACWPAPGSKDQVVVATPAFFASRAVDTVTPGAVVLALPQSSSANGAAAVMKWQIDADLRFSIIGGYSFFSRDGTPHYDAQVPAYATTLEAVGNSGVAPTPADIAAARQSLLDGVGDYVIVTDQVSHQESVLAVLPEIAGCTPERVSDVFLCRVVR
ncbi:hypothetical protein [Nakamurella panacisegetis]|uniref:hypothetical protein n=1 Tax=Nakamurella panacisegetis TaxID=1090615 RepID=UPI0012FD773D|nr:hypothetical protein [Nakamurella panacisegetis]